MHDYKNKYFSNCDVEVHDAGFVQRREWMLYKIRDDHYPFNVPLTFNMDVFDPCLFQKTIDLVVEKHEILRTTLSLANEGLKQIIHNPSAFPVRYTLFDFSKYASLKKETLLDRLRVMLFTSPFNFESGPLFRITVFAINKNLFEVLVIFHHLITDLHSLKIFLRDTTTIWESISRKTPVTKDTTAHAQYRRYSSLENKILDSNFGNPYKDYWVTQLNNNCFHRLKIIEEKKWSVHFQSVLEKIKEVRKKIFALPFYDHRFISSAVRKYRPDNAGMLNYVYSNNTFNNIQEFKKHSCSSLLSLFIASFVMTLNKISGQQFFLFDLVSSRKKNNGYENVIGWLSSNGVCFLDVNQNKGINAFLSYIDNQLFMLSSNSIYPYEVLQCDSDFPIGCAIPVLLVLVESNKTEDNPGTGITMHEFEYSKTVQDLSIFLSISENSCSAEIYYNNSLVDPEIIEKLILEQEQIVNSIAQENFAC